MEDKYKEIGRLLRESLNADYCNYYDCPFFKRCEEISKEEKDDYVSCDAIRVKIIEEKLKEFDKKT